MAAVVLKDSFGRIHDYLRISLTDRCNFRCLYCLPEPESGHHCDASDRMSPDEIYQIARAFVSLGIRKIRLTGGEPLVRRDAGLIMQQLGSLPVKLVLTTNGTRLHHFREHMRDAGISSVNISLDTLQHDRFFRMTGRDEFQVVWNNIEQALRDGLHVKLNMVVMKGYNEDELQQFVALTRELPVHVRFIEFMPFPGNRWRPEKLIHYSEIMETLHARFPGIEKLEDHPHDTTRKYRVAGHAGTFAIISTMSQPFCSGCNRLRVTSDGKMRNCLFAKSETDLLEPLRQGGDLPATIAGCLREKHWMLGGNSGEGWAREQTEAAARSMMGIGG